MKYVTLTTAFIFVNTLFAQQNYKDIQKLITAKQTENITGELCYIPAATYTCRTFSGADSFNVPLADEKRLQNRFYVKSHEVSNAEYDQFVSETKDSKMKQDTFVFVRDFPLAYNMPMTRWYFRHPKYFNYPAVGVTYDQAEAFCRWQQAKLNTLLKEQGKADQYSVTVRLPTLWEWESMAFIVGDQHDFIPLRNDKGYLANIGNISDRYGYTVKNYTDDGYLYPGPVDIFPYQNKHLYNLIGNVAEYVSTVSDTVIKTMDMVIKDTLPQSDKRTWHSGHMEDITSTEAVIAAKNNLVTTYGRNAHIAKGGSWAHSAFYIQPGVNLYVKPQECHSWVGFRPVYIVLPK